MTEEQTKHSRDSLIKYAIRWKNHPMCKGLDMYWDGRLAQDGSTVSSGVSDVSAAHLFKSVEDALLMIPTLRTPEGNLPADIVGVRRMVSWTIV